MSLAEGRFFSAAYPSDSMAIIINKNAADLLGWNDPIGKKIKIFGNTPYTVIGVINDFHYESLHQAIRPMGIVRMPSAFGKFPETSSIEISADDPRETLAFIQDQWENMGTGLPFDFSFFDQDYQQIISE